jgi:hypothetical protein
MGHAHQSEKKLRYFPTTIFERGIPALAISPTDVEGKVEQLFTNNPL